MRDRIPGELMPRDDILQFFTEDEAYLPEGHFSKDCFIRNLEAMVKGVFSEGLRPPLGCWATRVSSPGTRST